MITYVYLVIAIMAEVIATSTLKLTEEFTKPIPTLIVIVSLGVSLYFMSLTLRVLPVGIMYAFWSGFGIILVTISGIIFYRQTPDLMAIMGIALITIGILIINLFSTIKMN